MSTNLKIDTRWFRERLADRKLSQRGMARELGLDASAVSLLLRGKRKASAEEISHIATLIGAPAQEVIRRMGVEVAEPARTVAIAGTISAAGEIATKGARGLGKAASPPDLLEGAIALQYRGAGEMDGWVFYYNTNSDVPREAVGRLCVVAVEGVAAKLMRILRHGYRSGKFNLEPWAGFSGELIENAVVKSASPVLWIRVG